MDFQSKLFKTLLDNSPFPAYFKDRDGVYLGINRLFEEFTGFSENEIVGKNSYELVNEEIAKKYRAVDEQLIANPSLPQIFEFVFIPKEQSKKYDVIYHKKALVEDGVVVGLMGYIVDITGTTNQNRQKEILELSQLRTGIGNFEWNLNSDQFWCSSGLKNILKIKEENHICHIDTLFKRAHLEDEERAKRAIQYCSSCGQESYLEFRVIDFEGIEHIVSLSCRAIVDSEKKPIQIVGTIQDITEQKRKEEILQNYNETLTTHLEREVSARMETTKKYREIMEGVDELISLLDKKLNYVIVNKALLERFNTTEDAMVGKNAKEFLDEHLYDEHLPYLQKALLGTRTNRILKIESKNRGEIVLDFTYIPFVPTDEKIEGVIVVARDITEIEKIKLEQSNKERLLVQQSKMAMMGEMIGVIAHQWKQPLNNIALIADSIQDDLEWFSKDGVIPQDVVDSQSKHFGSIAEQVTFMATTIDDFKNFFKPKDLQTVFKVCEPVRKVHYMFRKQFERFNIEVTIEENNNFYCYGYQNEFIQVILNLLNNAKDAIVEKNLKEGKIECLFEESDSSGKLIIRDNAGGIKIELLPTKIFEAYVSTKGEAGTGIGLQICKTIIEERMQGKISAHNTKLGAEFVIELPIYRKNGE